MDRQISNGVKVALVHDYLNQYGGAERVLKALCELFPDAPIFTLFYDEKLTNGAFKKRTVITSFLQHVPGVRSHHRLFPLLMPAAIETFDFNGYELIISDSESFGKGIIVPPGALHVSYCHTPPRFLWDGSQQYLRDTGFPWLIKKIVPFGLTYLRLWDTQAAGRVDHFLANSQFVARRIEKYYKRQARFIYPPVALREFGKRWQKQDYCLLLMRLVPYKHPEIAIEAFNALGLPLKVVGSGPLLASLKQQAHSNIEFLGSLPHKQIAPYYAQEQALIFPQEEDFGISAVESCAAGTPVIAYAKGGAKEIISQGGLMACSLRTKMQRV